MGKKKKTTSVIVTIIITLIVLAGLSFAGVKYLLPIYTAGQYGSGDAIGDIYKLSVKIFPLLIGLVLIIIASMIASSRDEETDEDDKLPPNSYDNQLFEKPSDDPSFRSESPKSDSEPEFTPEEEQQFVSIFDAPEDEKPVEAEQAPEADLSVFESEPEEEIEEETEEPEVEEVAQPKAKEDALVDAIYALVNKLDEVSDVTYYDEFDEDFDDDEFEELDSVEPETSNTDLSRLENKVDKLCDAVANLATIITNNAVAVVAAAAPAPAPVVEDKQEEKLEEPVVEEVKEEEPEPAVEPVVEQLDEDTVLEDFVEPSYSSEAERFAKIEFDCAQNAGYDLSFAITDASLDDVALNLAGLGDAFEVNGKTLIVIPFLANDEIKAELDKIGAPYELKTIAGGETADFDEVIGKVFA